MRKLIIALFVAPLIAHADVTFYDNQHRPTGTAQQNPDGSWDFYDSQRRQTGTAERNPDGSWTFYDQYRNPIATQEGN